MTETSLSRSGGIPLHHQIAAVLRSAVASGRYGPGDLLPGEHTLTERFGVSRATVRRALTTLEAEHLVSRRPGIGTVVLEAVLSVPLAEHLRQIERGAARTTVDVLEYGEAVPPAVVSAALRSPEREPLLRFVRLRRRGAVPLRYLVNFVTPEVAAHLHRRDVSQGTLVGALRRHGHVVSRAEDEVGATLADPLVASALDLRAGDPLLEMTRVMHAADDSPLAFQWTLVSPSRFRLRLSVSGDEHEPVGAVDSYRSFHPDND